MWAGIVPYGPDGRQLTATWKESDKLDFQDSLGNGVLSVLGVVPDGVLLFLPSYSLMDKLMTRWKVREGLDDLKGQSGAAEHAAMSFVMSCM